MWNTYPTYRVGKKAAVGCHLCLKCSSNQIAPAQLGIEIHFCGCSWLGTQFSTLGSARVLNLPLDQWILDLKIYNFPMNNAYLTLNILSWYHFFDWYNFSLCVIIITGSESIIPIWAGSDRFTTVASLCHMFWFSACSFKSPWDGCSNSTLCLHWSQLRIIKNIVRAFVSGSVLLFFLLNWLNIDCIRYVDLFSTNHYNWTRSNEIRRKKNSCILCFLMN